MVWGLILMMFGGTFFTTIAAVEAYRIFGWKGSYDALCVIHANARAAIDASKKDDEKDDNNDGIADVKQISSHQLITRKLMLILRTVDPVQVNAAIAALGAGSLAVIATLRSKFANAITLGISLGQMGQKAASPYTEPALKRIIPAEYHRWIPVATHYLCASIGMSLAWFIERIISAFHSTLRGSHLFTAGLIFYLIKLGKISEADAKKSDKIFGLVGIAIGTIGFYWQISHLFNLPFPFNILLMPIRIVETLLMHVVGTASA